MKKILLTGATGYIGKRLLPVLLQNYSVYCCVRDKSRFHSEYIMHENCNVIEVDFLDYSSLDNIPKEIDGAYFLMHSMSASADDFSILEEEVANNFAKYISQTNCDHVVYLSGIDNDSNTSSKHLSSRTNVEKILLGANFNTTVLGAGIILGSGSSSFEIMRDLVEKLPLMVAPKWLLTKSQFIGVKDVIQFLDKTLFYYKSYNQKFDIYGPKIMNYKEMIFAFSKVRGLKRFIIQVPFLSPRLSSYWLYFVTSTSFSLARSLVGSMKVEIIAKKNTLADQLKIEVTSFDDAIKDAFKRVEQNNIVSSWKDSVVSGRLKLPLSAYISVPIYGCYFDKRVRKTTEVVKSLNKIWAIGGETGWYFGTWLWKIRGFIDLMMGGVGLRRGRTNVEDISTGDALDFWRVILADKKEKRLLLFAEMKLPGEAWLEFKIDYKGVLHQTATFRPKGVYGRIYWMLVYPFHNLIFNGMANKICE